VPGADTFYLPSLQVTVQPGLKIPGYQHQYLANFLLLFQHCGLNIVS